MLEMGIKILMMCFVINDTLLYIFYVHLHMHQMYYQCQT